MGSRFSHLACRGDSPLCPTVSYATDNVASHFQIEYAVVPDLSKAEAHKWPTSKTATDV